MPPRPGLSPGTAALCARVKQCCEQLAKEIPHLAMACTQLGTFGNMGDTQAKMLCEQVLQGFAMAGSMLGKRMPEACK